MVPLDLRRSESIDACLNLIEDRTDHIDLFVNNAGLTIVSPAEELPIGLAEEMMQVNFFGPARMVNRLLPGMRERKSGRIIFVSSLGGKMGVPGQAHYCSTKHALEGYADGLYAEARLFGVNVTLLEPGSFKTDIIERSPFPHWRTIAAYNGVREKLRDTIETDTKNGSDPQLIANTVLKAARSRKPKLRYLVDTDGKQAMFFKKLMPESVFYSIIAKRFGL